MVTVSPRTSVCAAESFPLTFTRAVPLPCESGLPAKNWEVAVEEEHSVGIRHPSAGKKLLQNVQELVRDVIALIMD
jgi:hypothetical protein